MLQSGETQFDLANGGRLAAALASVAGVEQALVASLDGELLAVEPEAPTRLSASRAAALATFIARRAESLTLDGDLRGMGRLLASARLEHVAITSAASEMLVYAPGGCYALISLRRGAPSALAAPAIEQVLRRYI